MQSRLAMNTHALMKTRNQRGAIFVLFAVTIPFLIAFSSLAIDMAYIYAEKEQLQNAADAAALAGGYALTVDISDSANYTKITTQTIVPYVNKNNSAQVENTASNYTNETIANSSPDQEIESTFPDDSNKTNVLAKYATVSDGKTVAVELRRRVPLHFMQYFLRPLGITAMPVAVHAKAQYAAKETTEILKNSSIFTNAIVTSSNRMDSIYMNNAINSIRGNIYTNGGIKEKGEDNYIKGSLTTALSKEKYGDSDIDTKYNATPINISLSSANPNMEDLINLLNSKLPEEYKNAFLSESFKNNIKYSSTQTSIYFDTTPRYKTYYDINRTPGKDVSVHRVTNADGSGYAAYIKTDTDISENTNILQVDTDMIKNYKIIIADGDIMTNNINIRDAGNTDIMLISLHGSVKIQETEPNHAFKGVAYAPNGKVELRAPGKGSIAAHDVYYYPHDGDDEPQFDDYHGVNFTYNPFATYTSTTTSYNGVSLIQ